MSDTLRQPINVVADLEKILHDSFVVVDHPWPEDFGDADRYVFLGPQFYAGLSLVSRVHKSGVTSLSPDEAVSVVREVAEEPRYANWGLLKDEHWCLAAIGAAMTTAIYNSEKANG